VKDLRGEVIEDCPECVGSGVQPQASECTECGGAGNIRQGLWFGWVSSTVACTACQGRGSTRPGCAACESSGKAPAKYRCRVRVPPGSRDGDLLHATARVQGSSGKQGVALRLHVALLPHDLFNADVDGTVTCEVPVDGFAWTANRWIEVPTPRGLQQMKLRRGFLSYRIKEAGLPWGPGAAKADCMVNVVPMFPDELTPEQEAAIDRLVQSNSGAKATPAGERIVQWKHRVEKWHTRLE
jgi:molecular chaperone DnaJ